MNGEEEVPSSASLAAGALKALGGWMATGLGTVDDATYAARLAACAACPFYISAPERAAYAVGKWWASDPRVCSKCGCFMQAKARLLKQRCPSAHPDDPAKSRWNEPME